MWMDCFIKILLPQFETHGRATDSVPGDNIWLKISFSKKTFIVDRDCIIIKHISALTC